MLRDTSTTYVGRFLSALLLLWLCAGQTCELPGGSDSGDTGDFATDFRVNVNPSIISGVPGESIDIAITAEATSGSSDAVQYSLTGDVPSGVTLDLLPCYGDILGEPKTSISLNTGGFSPVTCTATLVLGTETPPGDYELRVLGEFLLSEAVDDHSLQLEVLQADECPDDPDKIEPGVCGCGVPDTDSDDDGTLDCEDECPDDPEKTESGECGCGEPETDLDGSGTSDCIEECLNFTGTWDVILTNITSSCGDESFDDMTVVIAQTDCTADVTGVKGTSDIIVAAVTGNMIVIGPHDFSEVGGTTTSTFTYMLTSETTLTGDEEWRWSNGVSTCSNGTADVAGTKN